MGHFAYSTLFKRRGTNTQKIALTDTLKCNISNLQAGLVAVSPKGATLSRKHHIRQLVRQRLGVYTTVKVIVCKRAGRRYTRVPVARFGAVAVKSTVLAVKETATGVVAAEVTGGKELSNVKRTVQTLVKHYEAQLTPERKLRRARTSSRR